MRPPVEGFRSSSSCEVSYRGSGILPRTSYNSRCCSEGASMKRDAFVRCTLLQLCIGTFVAVPGIAQADGKLSDQTVLGVQCSQIFELGIDKQENLRAT